MRDHLVEKIFDSIRNESATGFEKLRAFVRAGSIAQAYLGESRDTMESVFGPATALQNDSRNDDRITST
jgi:hypothetical protein